MAKTGEKDPKRLEEMKKLLKPILKRILTERLLKSREQQPLGNKDPHNLKKIRKRKGSTMMKRAIAIIVVLLIGAYFVNLYIENKKKEYAKKAEKERIEIATREAVSQLVERTNAIANWEKDLSQGDKFRVTPILTVELERLWLTDRPIIFFGTIKDIATSDHDNYRIEIERSFLSNIDYPFSTELQLSLQCPKSRVDSFLRDHPDLLKEPLSGVAIIADIDKIETKIVNGSEGEQEEIKIGKGKCIDMLYTGVVRF